MTLAEAAFAKEGFAIIPEVLTSREVDSLSEELLRLLVPQGKAGLRHLLSNPAVSAVAHRPWVLGLAKSLLGPDAIPFSATLFNKSQTANWLIPWHQDTALPLSEKRDLPGWGAWSVKEGVIYAHAPSSALSQVVALRVQIDDSTSANGPLRVLPGTHSMGVLSDEEIHSLSEQIGGVTCMVPRGGILAMRPLLVHSSSKAQAETSRRVLHIEYSATAVFADGIKLAIA